MWIFSPTGFLSVVADPANPNRLLVRSRFKEDIEHVIDTAEGATPLQVTPHRDYGYRTTVPRGELADLVADQVDGIDYGNFKAHVDRVVGRARETLYAEVWAVMHAGARRLGAHLRGTRED